VNLSGAEFGGKIPGEVFHDYVWDAPKDATYFVGKGMNLYRIPFLWERIQLVAGGPLVEKQVQFLHTLVDYITINQSKYAIIDVHNYGNGWGRKIGEGTTAISLFADLWYKLALEFKNNPRVIFGLMNEPNDQKVTIWKNAAQAAINAIRFANATNMITVPGVDWTGAWTWKNNNAAVMGDIHDPLNNFVYEVHQYLDIDSSGTHDNCVNVSIGAERLEYFTGWARGINKKAILGEFGVGKNSLCGDALVTMLAYMDKNDNVWAGWTYWSAGPWWGDGYFSNLTPNSTGADRPQMKYVQPYISKATPAPVPIPAKGGSYTPPSKFAVFSSIYRDGSLISPYQDYSWAHHSLVDTNVIAPGSSKSISFDVSNYGALWFKCTACLDASKWFALEFMFNPGPTGNIGSIALYLMNNTVKVSSSKDMPFGAYTLQPSTPNSWVQVSIPLGWWKPEGFDGLQIQGNTANPVGTMYLDDIKLVAYKDNYSL